MSAALGSPHEVSGAAYLPSGTAELKAGRVALRIEGPAPSVVARRDSLLPEHRGAGTAEVLADAESIALWRAIGRSRRCSTSARRGMANLDRAGARRRTGGGAIARA